MTLNYKIIGKSIKQARKRKKLSQETLAEIIDKSSSYISYIETGKKHLSLETLVDIANALEVSADDLLVDSLKYSSSTADTEIHKLLLDCNEIEEQILIDTVKHLKATLSRLGI